MIKIIKVIKVVSVKCAPVTGIAEGIVLMAYKSRIFMLIPETQPSLETKG